VWWARSATATEELVALLDTEERARYERFVNTADRLRYLAAHVLARVVVAAYAGRGPATVRFAARCTTCGRSHGKPHLADPYSDLELSLAHSGGRVVVAVARGVAVGVDVEEVSGSADDVALEGAVLSPVEQRVVEALPSCERRSAFLRYWVRKEAVLKATGDGLALPPALLTVSRPDQPARVVHWGEPSRADVPVRLHDLAPGEAFVACLALLTDAPHRVVERDGNVLVRRAREIAALASSGGQRARLLLGSPNIVM
jgi:4'-phosphopantetheinyl transferase